jgi:hypothetical protein
MDRHADVVEVLGTADGACVRTLPLNGALTSNAAPDLTDVDPSGNLVFVAFRGPTPLSSRAHARRVPGPACESREPDVD